MSSATVKPSPAAYPSSAQSAAAKRRARPGATRWQAHTIRPGPRASPGWRDHQVRYAAPARSRGSGGRPRYTGGAAVDGRGQGLVD